MCVGELGNPQSFPFAAEPGGTWYIPLFALKFAHFCPFSGFLPSIRTLSRTFISPILHFLMVLGQPRHIFELKTDKPPPTFRAHTPPIARAQIMPKPTPGPRNGGPNKRPLNDDKAQKHINRTPN